MAKIILESGSAHSVNWDLILLCPSKSTYWPPKLGNNPNLLRNHFPQKPSHDFLKCSWSFFHWLHTTYLFPISDSVSSLRYLRGWKVNTLEKRNFFKRKACLNYNLEICYSPSYLQEKNVKHKQKACLNYNLEICYSPSYLQEKNLLLFIYYLFIIF